MAIDLLDKTLANDARAKVVAQVSALINLAQLRPIIASYGLTDAPLKPASMTAEGLLLAVRDAMVEAGSPVQYASDVVVFLDAVRAYQGGKP